MKKLLLAGITLALTLAVVVPAYAIDFGDNVWVSNFGDGKNFVTTTADTGHNWGSFGFSSIKTGFAVANTAASNTVGNTDVDSCTLCNLFSFGGKDIMVTNFGDGKNFVTTTANSGGNLGGGFTWTGGAMAGSLVSNVVGTTIVR